MKPFLPLLLLLSACSTTVENAAVAPAPRRAPIAFDGTVLPAFHVKSLSAAKAWYAEVLGCEVAYELAEMGWCEVTTPTTGALLGLSENPETKASGDAFLGFGVADMAEARKHLVAKKVTLDGDVIEIPNVVKLLYFQDPDGNKLMFYQPIPAAK